MTSRFTLLFAVAGISLAGCSSPAEGGGSPAEMPTLPPPGFGNTAQGGTTQTAVDPLQSQGGTAQTNTGQGGTANAPTAGTGNDGQAGTATLPPGDGEIPIGTGLAITPREDGLVLGEGNGLGIQGFFFTASDADEATTGTTIEMDTATTPGSVCASGTLAQIAGTPPDYTTYWGGLVGMNLRQVIPAGGGEALPASGWSRATPAGTVTGFSYNIAGTAIPGMRFTVDFVGKTEGQTFCAPIPLGATSTTLAAVESFCWGDMDNPSVPLGGNDLLTIQWSLLPDTVGPVAFDFCISNIQAIVSP